ncbi:MAG: ATP-binding cassette domain-containing protein, partial [Verrucomicrobiota bacterium]
GHKVSVSYFSQTHADELDPTRTVLETLEGHVTDEAAGNLRSILGAFLFRGDDVFKQVGVLSGGERGRLALAKMLLEPANLLILDEPTNHLDLQSQEVLQKALIDYTGTYLIVSHNRHFLDPIVSKVIEFIPSQSPKVYHGNVSDYLEKKAEEIAAQGPATTSSGAKANTSKEPNRKEQRRLEAQARQAKAAKLKPLNTELEAVEERISEIEQEKAELSAKLSDPEFFKDNPDAPATSKRFADAGAELEKSYTRWSEISEEIEKIEAES